MLPIGDWFPFGSTLSNIVGGVVVLLIGWLAKKFGWPILSRLLAQRRTRRAAKALEPAQPRQHPWAPNPARMPPRRIDIPNPPVRVVHGHGRQALVRPHFGDSRAKLGSDFST